MRDVFLATADAIRPLLDEPALEVRWDDASVLEAMSVAELTGHLSRAVIVVGVYLDQPGTPPLVDAPGYFLAIDGVRAPDLDGERATAIRRRGAEAAAGGADEVRIRWDRARLELERRFSDEDGSRVVSALGSNLRLDDYLVTRLVELAVHADDLAASLQMPPPTLDDPAYEAVLGCLWEMARRRSQPFEIIRAMTRIERDGVQALRVL